MAYQPIPQVAKGGATSPANAVSIAAEFNTSAPTYTNGQGGAIQMDASGRVKVTSQGITKAASAITDWTAVAQNTIAESATLDCSAYSAVMLHIQAALDTTTAHTGTRFIIQTSSNTSGDEDWQDYTEFVGLIGTAATDLIENNPLAAGSTAITLTGHALTTLGVWKFIKDGTLVNSELFFQVASSANSITLLDGTTNAHVQNVAIFNVALSQSLVLSSEVMRVRMLVDNTYDNNGSTLNYKLRATEVI